MKDTDPYGLGAGSGIGGIFLRTKEGERGREKRNSCGACARTCGDVQEVMDKKIGRRAYRIKGIVSAANFLEIPNLMVRVIVAEIQRFLRFCFQHFLTTCLPKSVEI